MQRLAAGGYCLGRTLVGADDLFEWPLEGRHQISRFEEAHIDLLVPETQVGALQVVFQRLLALSAIPIALREIERVARYQKRVGLGCERVLQDCRIVLIFPWVLTARSPTPGRDAEALGVLACDRPWRRLEIFVQNTFEGKGQSVAANLRAVEGHVAMRHFDVIQIVLHLRLERDRLEVAVEDQHVIGIDDHRIVDPFHLAQTLKGEGAVICKIAPWLVDDSTLDVVGG